MYFKSVPIIFNLVKLVIMSCPALLFIIPNALWERRLFADQWRQISEGKKGGRNEGEK